MSEKGLKATATTAATPKNANMALSKFYLG
jgi:hypothetical protein